MLRYFSLRAKESEYLQRMITQLNAQISPFKDKDKQDSLFLREMLDNYRKAEEFSRATTDRQITRNDRKVHEYLKIMESGESHPDT